MKKGLLLLLTILTLSISVGCSTREPTEEELKEYNKSDIYYGNLIASQYKWQDEIESSISSDVDGSSYNIDDDKYKKLMNDIKKRQVMVEDINLKEIEKYYAFKEYDNPDKEAVKEIRKKEIKLSKVKTEKLKENIKLYEEMVKLAEDGIISEDEFETKASLSAQIAINTDILGAVDLTDNMMK